jgi:hypothetical protein
VVDQIVEEEFRAARERLASFRTEYRELHARLLLKYVASDSLPALVRSLEDETLQSYFRAMREMSGEAAAGLETLGRKMKEAVPF